MLYYTTYKFKGNTIKSASMTCFIIKLLKQYSNTNVIKNQVIVTEDVKKEIGDFGDFCIIVLLYFVSIEWMPLPE